MVLKSASDVVREIKKNHYVTGEIEVNRKFQLSYGGNKDIILSEIVYNDIKIMPLLKAFEPMIYNKIDRLSYQELYLLNPDPTFMRKDFTSAGLLFWNYETETSAFINGKKLENKNIKSKFKDAFLYGAFREGNHLKLFNHYSVMSEDNTMNYEDYLLINWNSGAMNSVDAILPREYPDENLDAKKIDSLGTLEFLLDKDIWGGNVALLYGEVLLGKDLEVLRKINYKK